MHKARLVVATLLLCVMQPLVAQELPSYTGFDHLELRVTDLERSLQFYTRLFGAEVWRDPADTLRYLPLGSGYLVLGSAPLPQIGYVALGVDALNVAKAAQYLEHEGIAAQPLGGTTGLWLNDADGLHTQLVNSDSWQQLARTPLAAAEPSTAAPIFQPLRLDEVGLSVTNLEVDSLFYARVLGRSSTLQAGSLWYGFAGWRLRLDQAPAGRDVGVSYIGILIANTDLESAADAVFAAGGIIETLLPNGFSFWDPDGHRVVVHTTPLFAPRTN